jgi:hypothetical protein
MRSDDDAALAAGVPALAGGRELVMRRDGRVLVFQDRGGTLVAVARPRRWGRVSLEDAAGRPLAWFKPAKLAGEVEEGATPLHVELMLLLLVSNAAVVLERRAPMLPDVPLP